MPEIHISTSYTPNPKQALAHAAYQRWTLLGGGEGGGKSRWLVEEVIRLMVDYPGIEGVIGRYDANDVLEPTQVYDLFHRVCPRELIGGEFRSHPMWTRFVNGSRVTWVGLKDYSPSAEYGFVAIDQAEECEDRIVRLLSGRLRQRLPDGRFPHFRMLLTCNPSPKMEWFREECETHPDEYIFVPSLADDNAAHLPPDFFERRQKAYPDDLYKRLILGYWGVFVGMAIGEFNRQTHVVAPFDDWRRDKWPVFLGIDYGLSAPTVAEWLTLSPDGHLFFCQEYSKTGEVPADNAKAIASLSAGLRLRATWMDPRVAQVKSDLGRRVNWTVLHDYRNVLPNAQLAGGSRESRLAAWKQALKPNPDLVDYRTMQPPAPRLYIFSTCTGLIATLPKLQYKEVEVGHSDDITKSDDHWYDAGGFVLTHLLRSRTPYYQVRDARVKMSF